MRFTLTWVSLKESYELRPPRSFQPTAETTYLGVPHACQTESHYKYVGFSVAMKLKQLCVPHILKYFLPSYGQYLLLIDNHAV